MPKFNLYQSLHTTVVGPGGKPLEVQIRTREMHQRAEYGVAAHWGYKENTSADRPRVAEPHRRLAAGDERPRAVHGEPEDRPRAGRGLRLHARRAGWSRCPSGATPIDFAYSVHTEVGHACIGARVNGRLVPLDSSLLSGDTCEIFTSKVEGAGPVRDWLKIVVSPRARNKIRQWFSRERREDAIETGREELVKAMRREGLPVQKLLGGDVLEKTAVAMNYAEPRGACYVAIGENRVSGSAIAQRVTRHPARGRGRHRGPMPLTARAPRRAQQAQRRRRHPRRGARRRHGAPVALLHACAGRRDPRVRHAG